MEQTEYCNGKTHQPYIFEGGVNPLLDLYEEDRLPQLQQLSDLELAVKADN